MSSPFLGEIRLFAGNFAVTGWAVCNGALLSISQNSALFSILGTTYGGDGQTTFALPNWSVSGLNSTSIPSSPLITRASVITRC